MHKDTSAARHIPRKGTLGWPERLERGRDCHTRRAKSSNYMLKFGVKENYFSKYLSVLRILFLYTWLYLTILQ